MLTKKIVSGGGGVGDGWYVREGGHTHNTRSTEGERADARDGGKKMLCLFLSTTDDTREGAASAWQYGVQRECALSTRVSSSPCSIAKPTREIWNLRGLSPFCYLIRHSSTGKNISIELKQRIQLWKNSYLIRLDFVRLNYHAWRMRKIRGGF